MEVQSVTPHPQQCSGGVGVETGDRLHRWDYLCFHPAVTLPGWAVLDTRLTALLD